VANTLLATMSKSRYLMEELPEFITRTFIIDLLVVYNGR